MKKLIREEMKTVKAGGGGGGEVLCKFFSTSCGNLCYDVDSPPYFYTSCAAAFSGLPGFNPSCHYTYKTVTSCP